MTTTSRRRIDARSAVVRTKRNGCHFAFHPKTHAVLRATGVGLAERSNVFFLWLQTARMAGSGLPGTIWIWVAADQALTLLVNVVVLSGR